MAAARRLSLLHLRRLHLPHRLDTSSSTLQESRRSPAELLFVRMPSVVGFPYSSSSSSSPPENPPPSSSGGGGVSWLQRLKGFFVGQGATTPATSERQQQQQVEVPSHGELNLETFADELKKARAFGKMTQFGRGLPRGGEAIAARSLHRQEDILRKLATYSPDGQRLETRHKQEAATQCGCTLKDVNDVLGKYEWAKEANSRMMRLKAEGKPLPKSLDEVEKMMGSRWKAAASVNLSKEGGQTSRNALCPCGSGKKYKRCCGKS